MVSKMTLPRKLPYNLPDEALDISLGLSFGLDSVCKHIGHDVNIMMPVKAKNVSKAMISSRSVSGMQLQ